MLPVCQESSLERMRSYMNETLRPTRKEIWGSCCVRYTQVGFAEFNNTADNRANIGGTIIGAPIVGQ